MIFFPRVCLPLGRRNSSERVRRLANTPPNEPDIDKTLVGTSQTCKVFIARGKEDMLCTKSMAPYGSLRREAHHRRFGLLLFSRTGEAEAATKVEYRV
jgi:hypothetical protein